MKDYSHVPPKSYQSTFSTWIRGYSGPIKDIPIDQYLEENLGTCEYLKIYLDCLTTAKELGAYRRERRWFLPETGLQYENVVELCQRRLAGPFKSEACYG